MKARRSVVDEYDPLERWYLEIKPKLDRRKELADQIRDWYEDSKQFPGTQAIRAEGSDCYLDLTACKDNRRITSPAAAFRALKQAMGLTALINAITITFKLLDRHVPEKQQEDFVVTEPVGPRTIILVPKAS